MAQYPSHSMPYLAAQGVVLHDLASSERGGARGGCPSAPSNRTPSNRTLSNHTPAELNVVELEMVSLRPGSESLFKFTHS